MTILLLHSLVLVLMSIKLVRNGDIPLTSRLLGQAMSNIVATLIGASAGQ